jgi:hypothetical protein
MVYLDAEMEIDMQGSILETKFMDLEFTILRMDIVMKERGTRVVDKVSAHILFEMVIEDVVNGMLVTSSILCHHKLMLSFERFRCLFVIYICLLVGWFSLLILALYKCWCFSNTNTCVLVAGC